MSRFFNASLRTGLDLFLSKHKRKQTSSYTVKETDFFCKLPISNHMTLSNKEMVLSRLENQSLLSTGKCLNLKEITLNGLR